MEPESGPAPRPAADPPVARLAKTLLAFFFRRVEVTGLAELPDQGGGLLLAWHPNGLIDPALVLARFPGRVVFGARHGLFAWPLLGSILRRVAVPIYRRQDRAPGGDESAARKGNQASLAALAGAVDGGSFAMLFPEGDSHDEPHPLELKTGAARLALDVLDRWRVAGSTGAPPAIVPVGLHYDQKSFFRSRALVAFHPPLEVAALLARPAASEEERQETVRRLTARFAEALDRTALATDDWREHHLMHRMRRLMRAERAARAGADPGPVDMRERMLGFARVWTAWRALGEERSPALVAVRRRVGAYDRFLRRLGLEDHELDRDPDPPRGRELATLAAQRFVLDWLLLPLALAGFAVNLLPALLLALLARLTARRKKDVATIKLLFGALLFPATWIALGVFTARAVERRPWATGIAAAALAAFGGMIFLVYGRLSRRWGHALLVRAKRRFFRRWVDRLRAERASIFDEATALSSHLELPGRVGPGGEILG